MLLSMLESRLGCLVVIAIELIKQVQGPPMREGCRTELAQRRLGVA